MIAPSVAVEPVDVGAVFDAPPGDGGAVGGGFGYLAYPDAGADGRGPSVSEAAGGWSDCVLRQDRDGSWWSNDQNLWMSLGEMAWKVAHLPEDDLNVHWSDQEPALERWFGKARPCSR